VSQHLTIVGPNLRDQSKGQFVVHATGCRDLTRLARREPEVANAMTGDFDSLTAVATYVYADIIDENQGNPLYDTAAAYVSEFHFCPCVTLPHDAPTVDHDEQTDEPQTITLQILDTPSGRLIAAAMRKSDAENIPIGDAMDRLLAGTVR
jgi:hypothetical protein